jgi:hypothetical protein
MCNPPKKPLDSPQIEQRKASHIEKPKSHAVTTQGVWVAKEQKGANIVEQPTLLIPKSLEEKELNISQKQPRDVQSSKKTLSGPQIEQRKVSYIERPKSHAVTSTTQVPKNYSSLLCGPSSDKIKIDSDYFNSLEIHSRIENLCLDRKAEREYTYTIGNNPESFKAQIKLAEIYRKLGMFIPERKILNIAEGLYVFLTQRITVKKPSQYLLSASAHQIKQFYTQICKAFVADILFMNMPVLQGDLDAAYRVNEKGMICRISASPLNVSNPDIAYPLEIWAMRDSTKNPASKIWETLDMVAIANQIISLIKGNNDLFYGLPDSQKAIANKRLTNLLILANKTLSMSKDGWHTGYIDSINQHMLCLKKFGCEERLPIWLYPNPKKDDPNCKLRGPNGILFEGFRWENSVVETVLMPYVAKNNGNYQCIIDWMVGHESSGWSVMSQVLMHFLTLHRKAPNAGYFWKEGVAKAKLYYDQRAEQEGGGDPIKGAKIIENSFIMLHAFTQIVLGHVNFPNNFINKEGEGTVKFLRTESKHVMTDQRIWSFRNNINMQMASYSSGSVVAYPPLVHGTEVTERIIPHHRVLALYFMLCTLKEAYRGAFSNDFQNEFTAILGGINCNYIDSISRN